MDIYYHPRKGNLYDDDMLEKWYQEAVVSEHRPLLSAGSWLTVARILKGIADKDILPTDVIIHWWDSTGNEIIAKPNKLGYLEEYPEIAHKMFELLPWMIRDTVEDYELA
jgi:hypothetical protein